jgi:hypothetical protein
MSFEFIVGVGAELGPHGGIPEAYEDRLEGVSEQKLEFLKQNGGF